MAYGPFRTLSIRFALLLSSLALAAACSGTSSDDPGVLPENEIARPATGRSGPLPTETPLGGALRPDPEPTFTPVPAPAPAQAPVEGLVGVTYTPPFIWPVDGPISSFMGPEHPSGIDIAFDDAEVMPSIRAAAGGTVTSAGEDDPDLGLSVVIDHGNGVTTTYGHLSELQVSPGDTVRIGDVIGIGGSTGISTGAHLHLEVRKDGDTVDPLQVLPSNRTDNVSLNFDCEATPLTLPSGSQAIFNFEGVLDDGERLAAASFIALNGGADLASELTAPTRVEVGSTIDFDGPDGLDSYDFELVLDGGNEERVLVCPLVIQRNEVPTTFYVRAFPTHRDGEQGEPAPTPEPTPTPTPPPAAAEAPSYQSPGGDGSGAPSSPDYSVPGSGSGTPNYGIPSSGSSDGGGVATPAAEEDVAR